MRSELITVSDEEAKSRFGLDERWRPLEYIQNDFKDNEDGTITDHATGLMWQKSGSSTYKPYRDASAYIKKLNSDRYAGYSDWRMPTVDELKSLLTQERQSNDLYISTIFDKNQSSCWTSDRAEERFQVIGVSGLAWCVHFDGDVVLRGRYWLEWWRH